jgi:hypothetical protein
MTSRAVTTGHVTASSVEAMDSIMAERTRGSGGEFLDDL